MNALMQRHLVPGLMCVPDGIYSTHSVRYGRIQHMFNEYSHVSCLPKGSHLIHWTSAVCSQITLK